MKKQPIIKVPKGIRYLSEWKDFKLPDFPCILDKEIPGCGFTEYCITSSEDVILCSPRRLLLKNKEEQHPNEVFYVQNEFDPEKAVDKDLENRKKNTISSRGVVSLIQQQLKSKEREEELRKQKAETILKLKQEIKDYIYLCNVSSKPIKLLVTYDSFKIIKEVLIEMGILERFRVVVDEFQSIFTDSKFKSNTELEFLNYLQDISKVSFVSATPMIDDYLEELDEFKDLPYFELDWASDDYSRVLEPDFKSYSCRSINEPAYEIIQKYLEGDFETAVIKTSNGNLEFKYSKEAVFYINSVNNIIGIVNKCNLKPEQCNIIIADTLENRNKLKKKLGKEWTIGTPPKKGAEHKMFTFCTRTVYLGADFYSPCARTFILSDANIETLSVDIELDLPQILGRQRNFENPWKNRAEFYYKTSRKGITQEDFDSYISTKMSTTLDLLRAYDDADDKSKIALANNFKDVINLTHYRTNYVAVNEHKGSIPVPCLNKLVMLAEKRSFDLQNKFYGSRASVINSFFSSGLIKVDNIKNLKQQFDKEVLFKTRMKLLCENDLSESEILIILEQVPLEYKNFYIGLGPARCKALSYARNELQNELSLLKFDQKDLKRELDFIFKIGEVYSLSEIKEKLRVLYESLGYMKTPKANDLLEHYEVKNYTKNINKKRIACYKIIKKL